MRLRILTRDEISKLLDSSVEHLRPILVMALSTAMRKGEILSMKCKHLDFENGFIRITNSKNGEARNIPMDSYLQSVLFKLTHNKRYEDYVFTRSGGRKIKSIKEAFKSACKRSGIEDFRFHDLRHTAASLLAAGGCDIITLQNILGHKSLAMTQRYAHLIPHKHKRTRQIMQEFWTGDTHSDAVKRQENCHTLSH